MTEAVRCSDPLCEREYADHKWGRINASKAGWFFQTTGETWCPEHMPEWVTAWRERKGHGRPDQSTIRMVATCRNCGKEIMREVGESIPWRHGKNGPVTCKS